MRQLATPVELYEQPSSRFVAGFVGTSNLLQGRVAEELVGEPGPFVIRPERITLLPEGTSAEPGTVTASGVVTEVAYLGASTRTIVALDAGVPLTVDHPNTDSSIGAALERREQRVALSWRRDHLVALEETS